MKKMILNVLKGLLAILIVASLGYFSYSFIKQQNDQIAQMQEAEIDRIAYEDSVLTVEKQIEDQRIKRVLSSLEEKLNITKDELNSCNQQFEKSYSGRKIKLLNKDINNITSNHEELNEKYSNLTNEFQLLKIDNSNLNNKVIELSKENSELNINNKKLSDEKLNFSSENALKDSKIDKLNTLNNELNKNLEIYITIVEKLKNYYSKAEEAFSPDEFNEILDSIKVKLD